MVVPGARLEHNRSKIRFSFPGSESHLRRKELGLVGRVEHRNGYDGLVQKAADASAIRSSRVSALPQGKRGSNRRSEPIRSFAEYLLLTLLEVVVGVPSVHPRAEEECKAPGPRRRNSFRS